MKKLLTKTNQKGITLVALVITIIVLLTLAGISISALTNQELFVQANRAKKETQRAQVTEWLNLKLMEEQMYNPTGTAEEIIEATRIVTYGNTELEKMGKNVVVDENTSTLEDGEQVAIYFYVQVDEDVYKVEMAGVQFIGEAGKFPPVIKLESITNTTNSITLKIKVSRNEEGTLEIYKKTENDTEYTREKIATGEEAKGLEYTFSGLEQNKTYSIKIVATAQYGQVKECTREITTAKQLVNEIKITPESATVQIEETLDLAVTISPEDAYNRDITWNSSNPEVATIEQNGKVTAIAEGTTTITAIAQDGSNVQGSCTLTVEETKLYLYNRGDKCENITGGWEGKVGSSSHGNVTDKGTSLYAYCDFYANYYARWYTSNQISLNGYKKVVFKGKFTTPYGTNGVEYSTFGKLEWFVKSIKPDASGKTGHTTNSFGIIAHNGTGERNVLTDLGNGMKCIGIDGGEYEYMEIPIEDINESKYISIECQIGSSFELTECYLE